MKKTYPPPTSPMSELERLRFIAKEEGNVGSQIMEIYGTERAVIRLAQHPQLAQKLVLKGGYLLRNVLDKGIRRTTLDADFYAQSGSENDVIQEITDALAQTHTDDQIVFDTARIHVVRMQEEKGIRLQYHGKLGKSDLHGNLDIGFKAVLNTGPEMREIKPLLRHAQTFTVQAYPLANVMAEKYETILSRGSENTRLKDYYDLAALIHHTTQDKNTVKEALIATCQQRETPIPNSMPSGLTPEFYQNPRKQSAWNTMGTKGAQRQEQSLAEACTSIWNYFQDIHVPK